MYIVLQISPLLFPDASWTVTTFAPLHCCGVNISTIADGIAVLFISISAGTSSILPFFHALIYTPP
ncbi:hypothetical protein BZA77DRAFT_316857 [Pyronema omphalodes]|nr:hypothetical protein BZA77DRAFT_316857 [Pyronema omphalodes]